jgi:ferric-dicitrate binding protein FerR (iron transport regulator)
MKRKILGMVSLLVVLTLGFAAVAEAAEVEGSGRLWARGAGYAEIHGSGVVPIAGHGVGMVSVKGAEMLRAQGQGRRWDLPDGTTVFAGWRGHIHIEGHGLQVHMLGGVIEFTAQGTGTVLLKGRGHYRVNGQSGRWTLEGVRIPLSAPADSDSE